MRVRAAHRDEKLEAPRAEEWLLVEWPQDEAEPTTYWLSTLPADIPFPKLVDLAKLRWRIERDYQELKQDLGLGHYEGRGWRGFHHHATLCTAAYGFLIAERGTISPQDQVPPRSSRNLPFPPVTDLAVVPIRPERHIPNSIATLRRRLTVALAKSLDRCPCCHAQRTPQIFKGVYDTIRLGNTHYWRLALLSGIIFIHLAGRPGLVGA